jgi:integrase/recombinase XerD
MPGLIRAWLDYLLAGRGLSRNTAAAYEQDLQALLAFMEASELQPAAIDEEQILLFIAWLRGRGDGSRSLARRLSALRGFFAWCVDETLFID